MKKLLYCAAALAAMFFTACQQENLEPVQNGSTVTFNVEVPGTGVTKAVVDDGSNINDLVYAVYKTEHANLNDAVENWDGKLIYKVNQTETQFTAEKTTSVSIELLNDQNYVILFWAQKDDAWVKGQDFDLTNITYPLDAEGKVPANDNGLEAFSGVAFVAAEDVDGGFKRTVTLTRPFAQINIGTIEPKVFDEFYFVSSGIIAEGAGNNFNVASQSAASRGNITFKPALIPAGKLKVGEKTTDYTHVAMNYVFVNDNLDNLTYTINTNHGTVTKDIPAVPVLANYRTNIVGNLLTSNAQYDIKLDQNWGTPEHVIGDNWTQTGSYEYTINEGAPASTLKEVLEHAINQAGSTQVKSATEGPVVTIDLAADVEWETGAGIGSTPLVPEGSPISAVVINGNGKTFTATGKGVGKIRLANGGKLTLNNLKIVDESVSYAEDSWEYGYLEFGGVIRLENCEVVNAIMLSGDTAALKNCSFNSNKDGEYAVWVDNGSAYFTNCTFEGARGLKTHEAYGSEVVKITVDGCTFNNISKKPGIAIGTVNEETVITIKNSFFFGCQPGDQGLYSYETDTDVNSFTFVLENNEVHADPSAMFNEWVKNAQPGDVVKIPAGEYTFPESSSFKEGVTLMCAEGTIFTGQSSLDINGATVVGASFANESGTAVRSTVNGTFKNCVFTGSNATRYCYAGKTVVFENCVFDGAVYGMHFDGGENSVIFRSCQLSGFNAFGSALTDLTFENCVFKSTGKSGYNGANLWGKTTMTGCEFIFDGQASTEWIGLNAAKSGKELVFTDCVVKDAEGNKGELTAYFANYSNGCKVKVDGVELTLAEDAEGLTAAFEDKAKNIVLMPGTYEGTFKPAAAATVKSASSTEKAVIKGRVNIDNYADGIVFENVKFEINDASKVKPSFPGAQYKYPGIVVMYATAATFEGCEFASDFATGVCGINYGAYAPGKLLKVNNCKFTGDFYAIRTRTLFEITNNEFNVHTDQGTLAAVWTWGNGEAGTKNNSGADVVTFTGNTNVNTNKVYGVLLASTNFNYCELKINVQENTNFHELSKSVNPSCDFTGSTFLEGSETFEF